MNRSRMSLCAAAVIGAMAATGVAAAPSAQAARARHVVPHTAPSWLGHATSKGKAAAKGTSHFRVYLAPQGGLDALKADAAAVADPSSASYQKFLTSAQYHQKYDATAASVKKVKSWLKDNGLKAGAVKDRRYLDVSGTNAAAEKAFGTTIKKYSHEGQTVQANATEVSVPDSVASLVLTVSGLDTTPHIITHGAHEQAPPPAGFRNAKPCSISYGQVKATYQADFKTPLPKFNNTTLPYAPCGYTGPQYRAAYESGSTLDGTGSTVAIVDAYAAPTLAKDSNTYASQHGDGSYGGGQLTQTVPGKFTHQAACDPSGWYGEETLDVEAVHAMAPASNIHYYGAASCYDEDFLNTLAQVVDDNDSDVVTNSWGDAGENGDAASINAYEQVFLQAGLQGQSFTFSSGDSGDELANTGIKQADYPASDPYVTAVGGTADAIDASGKLAFQAGWGTQKYSLSADAKSWTPNGFLYGAGGGASALFNQPTYQNGVVPASFGPARQVPDIALDADPNTGMLIGETQTFPDGKYYGEYRIGGTSLASPLFAGMSALKVQQAGGRVGFQNPAIYKAAGTAAISDVKGAPKDAGVVRVDYANGLDASGGLLYSVRTFSQDSSLPVAKGYDNVTGVGSPTSAWLTQK
ncbi:MAG: physarolisin [Nocardioidaceae bacterium]|nr:physarolisin [Nocardioidaceae bacterium]